jgi:hypothetical protein
MYRDVIGHTLWQLRAKRSRVQARIASVNAKIGHIDDHDRERYYLGTVTGPTELQRIEQHLLWCLE